MNIFLMVKNALEAAAKLQDAGDNEGEINKNRSKNFVEAVAENMRKEYQRDSDVFVLSRHFENHARFGCNELLFDILACHAGSVTSALQGTPLTYVTKGLWAIESEMAKDSRAAIYDFNKLVLADCERKLFIGPITADIDAYMRPLEVAASNCKGNLRASLVSHPGDWGSGLKIECFLWQKPSWMKVPFEHTRPD